MKKFYSVNVKIKGNRPLLQNEMVDTGDEVAKTGQTYDDQEEAEKRLIKNTEGKICQKAEHLESAMVKSAAAFKFKGQKTYKTLFQAGVFVEPLLIPHINPIYEIDRRFVKIQRARIPRCRPRFDDWSLEFTIDVTDNRIPPATLKSILEDAGVSSGIGDYRPRYGLFEIEKFEVIDFEGEKTE